MKRMWSLKQIKDFADIQAKGVKKDIATLVDADGHDRFISFEGEVLTLPEDYEVLFTGGSLSGTHLMMIAYFKTPDSTSSITTSDITIDFEIPGWIYDIIYTPDEAIPVDYKDDFSGFKAGSTGTPLKFALLKTTRDNKKVLRIVKYYTDTPTTNCYYRVAFDLYIE